MLFTVLGNCYSVDLKKGSQGLGFSIIGGETSVEDDTIQYVSRVKRVFPIGPAADSKRILAGDVILLVNGKDMRRLNHSVSNTLYIVLYTHFYQKIIVSYLAMKTFGSCHKKTCFCCMRTTKVHTRLHILAV